MIRLFRVNLNRLRIRLSRVNLIWEDTLSKGTLCRVTLPEFHKGIITHGKEKIAQGK